MRSASGPRGASSEHATATRARDARRLVVACMTSNLVPPPPDRRCVHARHSCKNAHRVTSDDLRFFQAILRTGSLVAAGAALAVDRTTVGRRLDQLEARLGVSLFIRTRTGLQPTGAALRLGEQAERILRELRELETTTL